MMLRLWYARRAIPWPAVGTCLATAALGVGVTRWHDHLAALVLPLAALLAARLWRLPAGEPGQHSVGARTLFVTTALNPASILAAIPPVVAFRHVTPDDYDPLPLDLEDE